MKCPKCSKDLERVSYEGQTILQCDTCFGYLVSAQSITVIKSNPETAPEDLKEEAKREKAEDSVMRVRCPRCRMKMRKEKVRKLGFSIDHCASCKMTWLDGGELAKLQMLREGKAAVQDVARFKKRWADMPPDERQAFEEGLAGIAFEPEPDADSWDD